jgi:hypothetical protein
MLALSRIAAPPEIPITVICIRPGSVLRNMDLERKWLSIIPIAAALKEWIKVEWIGATNEMTKDRQIGHRSMLLGRMLATVSNGGGRRQRVKD